jgi:hypothetical protein
LDLADTDAALSIEATFTREVAGPVAAVVVMTGRSGNTMARRFRAGSCVEAADAAALIIAVTLDPTAGNEPPGEAGAPADGSPASGAAVGPSTGAKPSQPPLPSAPPDQKERVLETPLPADSPPGRKAAEAPPPAAPAVSITVTPPPPGPARLRVGGGLRGHLLWGPAPALLLGMGLYAVAALERDALWSPEVVIGALRAGQDGLVEVGGTASFVLVAASVDACPLRAKLSFLAVRACASALAGRLSTSGSATTNAASVNRPFALVGGAVVVGAALGSRLELAARLGVGAPLARDWYLFGGNQFHRSSLVTLDGSLGIGIRWP